ncbi:MAG TPA: hypothetical protein VG013_04470 [Gemmataceae bacterium]|jgi:hypothetical protein|nr:hypothetical protein [Gemmataceae bacterium]
MSLQLRAFFPAVVSTIAALLMPSATNRAVAQWQPIGNGAVLEVRDLLSDLGQTTFVYRDNDPQKGLVYLPFFAFKRDNKRLLVDKSSPDHGRCYITVHLLITPDNRDRMLRQLIQLQAKQRAIQSMPLNSLLITQLDPSERIAFKPVSIGRPDTVFLGKGVDLRASVLVKDAASVQHDLQTGKLIVRFAVAYTGHVLEQKSASAAFAEFTSFSQAEASVELEGAATAAVTRVSLAGGEKVTGENVSQAAFVTRNQSKLFEASLRQEVRKRLVIERIDDEKYLAKDITQYLGGVFARNKLLALADAEKVNTAFQAWAAYGFDSKDIEPDHVSHLISRLNTYFQTKDKQDFQFESEAEANLFSVLFGGKAQLRVQYNELRERLSQAGWDFDKKGNFFMPKSIDVRKVDIAKLRTGIRSWALVQRVQRRPGTYVSLVSTRDLDRRVKLVQFKNAVIFVVGAPKGDIHPAWIRVHPGQAMSYPYTTEKGTLYRFGGPVVGGDLVGASGPGGVNQDDGSLLRHEVVPFGDSILFDLIARPDRNGTPIFVMTVWYMRISK